MLLGDLQRILAAIEPADSEDSESADWSLVCRIGPSCRFLNPSLDTNYLATLLSTREGHPRASIRGLDQPEIRCTNKYCQRCRTLL